MIVRCTKCDAAYVQYDEIVDCVTITAEYTDGRVVQDVGRDDPFFVCRRCNAVLPYNDVMEAAWKIPVGFRRLFLRSAASPTAEQLLNAIESKTPAEFELELRREAWRIANDARRDWPDFLKRRPSTRPPWWHENIRRLLELETEPLLLAELYRETEQFGRAISVLEAMNDAPAQQIKQLAARSNPHVRRIRWKKSRN